MARRIRWQIIVTALSSLLIALLLGHLALSTAAQGEPTSGGSYTEGLVGEVNDLNPLRGAQLTRAERDLTALLFEGLTRIETTGIVAPSLATEWTTDGSQKVYTFTLRPNVTWHDGVAFSAEDVVWTINWIKNPAFNGDRALAVPWQAIFVSAPDANHVRFDLPARFAPFPQQLAIPILPAHLLQNASPATWASFSRQPIGTGVYALRSLGETQVELEVYPNYRRSAGRQGDEPVALPNLNELIFKLYPTLEDASLAARRGDIQALAYNLTERGELPLPPGYQRVRAPLADYTVLTFNLRTRPLDELAVRQALSYAIDQQAIIDTALKGFALPLLTPVLPSSWAWANTLTPYADDPSHSRATALLEQARWRMGSSGVRMRDGRELSLPLLIGEGEERNAVAQVLAAQLETIGINVVIEQVSNDELNERLNNHEFTLALHGWSNLGSDPDVYELWHSSQISAANFAGLADDQLDELLVQARQQSDFQTRAELYQAFQERWLALAPSVMLYQPLLEQQVAPEIQVLGMAAQASEAEILYTRADRFRRVANWYQTTTRQLLPNLRRNPNGQRPR